MMMGLLMLVLMLHRNTSSINQMGAYDNVHRVRVYPRGINEDAAELHFLNKEDKNNYIIQEFKACNLFELAYRSAMTSKLRISTHVDLIQARVKFASSIGFIPKQNEYLVWIRQKDSKNGLTSIR